MTTNQRTAVAATIAAALIVGACGSSDRGDGPADPTTTTTTSAALGSPTTRAPAATTSSAAPVAGASTTTVVPSTTQPPATLEGPETTADASPEDPVPVGEVLEIEGLWDIAVTAVDLDAAETVLAYADINPAPEAGHQYVLVTIEGIYLGDRVAQPVFEWAISGGGETFEPYIPGCGVLPDSIYDVVEVAPGAYFRANMCVPVTTESVLAGLELYLQPPGDAPRYFDLVE